MTTTIQATAERARFAIPTKRLLGLALLLAIACVLPFILSSYQTFQATMVLVYAIALLGLNILTGFNGQISLGHGAFYAIGAYVTAILIDQSVMPYWATIPVAGIVCLAIGFLFGLPATRLSGLYLALATFALAVATPQLLKYHGLETWTGGSQGIILDKPAAPSFIPLNGDRWLYFVCLAVTVPMFVIGRNLLHGRTGRALVAIRDHPIAAASMGIDTSYYKAMTFGISAFYTGVAGALGALTAGFVSPDSFVIFLSITLLVGMVVGGVGSIMGAFFGAAFIEFVPDLADKIANISDQLAKAGPWAIYGVFLIGFMYLMPAGVAGLLRRWAERLGL